MACPGYSTRLHIDLVQSGPNPWAALPPSDGDALMALLASAWFYGGWKAETYNEWQMQEIMERAGWWPIPSESALHQALDGGPRPARIGL